MSIVINFDDDRLPHLPGQLRRDEEPLPDNTTRRCNMTTVSGHHQDSGDFLWRIVSFYVPEKN